MTFSVKENIRPVSDFRKAAAQLLKKLNANRHPIILTQRGRSVAVIVDVDTYERLEYERQLRASCSRGLEDLEQGKTVSHRRLMSELQKTLAKTA